MGSPAGKFAAVGKLASKPAAVGNPAAVCKLVDKAVAARKGAAKPAVVGKRARSHAVRRWVVLGFGSCLVLWQLDS